MTGTGKPVQQLPGMRSADSFPPRLIQESPSCGGHEPSLRRLLDTMVLPIRERLQERIAQRVFSRRQVPELRRKQGDKLAVALAGDPLDFPIRRVAGHRLIVQE
jgi:hypothetical protein